ncbi:DUF1015 family protein [Streptomyces aidingensis]|uniref:DUF1015 domain-containing protein n=1 Tax=Streptomyces aidingensis TaxID=910347 RepID=A0A1I1RCN2_9ACTN|nr:DUF1015 family protein [Streptomyces aidingensis]SFD32136.1 Protein of unknown function [Streptomyces aidingensis]
MPSDVLSPPALPSTPKPRTDLLIPSHVMERRDAFGSVRQRGVIGALDVRGIETGHVLRHSRTDEAEVRRQVRLLCERDGPATEPLLLAAPDVGGYRSWLDEAAGTEPGAVLETPDGGELLLWGCRGEGAARPPALGPVLLMDGHHRLEAARRLAARAEPAARDDRNDRGGCAGRAGPAGASAGRTDWRRLPALVVDHARHPLTLSATHRVLPGLDLPRAVRTAGRFAQVRRRPAAGAGSPAALLPGPARGTFLLAGDGQVWEVSGISFTVLASRLRTFPPEWAELEAAVSDHVLIPLLCEDQGLVPTPRYTTAAAVPAPGEVGLILPAPTWNQVWAGAANGSGMPYRSTSVGPRPIPDLLAYLS